MTYYLIGEEHEIANTPHGNSKKSTPYKCIKLSTLLCLNEICESILPSKAYSIVENDVGGIMNADSSGSLPKRRQQVTDFCRILFKKDELSSLLEQCKFKKGENSFIRCIPLFPEPVIIVLAINF